MGGYNSGRSGGRPTVEMSKRIDIAWMIRTRRAIPGSYVSGSLHWNIGGEPAESISYTADMSDQDCAELRLSYTRGDGADRESVKQTVRLEYTTPNYGGRRWWMICPYRHNRCGKLYLPNWGDRFAGWRAWRLGYKIQRVAHRDRVFEQLFRLQKKLGCDQGWEAGLVRQKGMHHKTFERHMDRYWALDEACSVQMVGAFLRLRGG
jgi:hypothetical protein